MKNGLNSKDSIFGLSGISGEACKNLFNRKSSITDKGQTSVSALVIAKRAQEIEN